MRPKDKMKIIGLLVVALSCLMGRAHAQVDVATAVGPDTFLSGGKGKAEVRVVVSPLALAAGLAFDSASWAEIQISTSSTPARELTGLQQKGYYKLELYQVILLAMQAKKPLAEIAKDREKGLRLREISKNLGQDYDELYSRSLALDKRVTEEFLPKILTVSSRSGGK